MKTINKETLKEKLKAKDIKLIEVLDENAYRESHIKGAINIPLKKIGLEANKRFSKDDQLVVYCSNHDCSASPTAAKKLEGLGFSRVYDYEGGKQDWKDAGLPMAHS